MIDLNGKNYAPTYKRRAGGLVKAGRARWSDENKTKICLLASPAHKFEEDTQMYEKYDNDGNLLTGLIDVERTPEAGKDDDIKLSTGYVARQIEKIRDDIRFVEEAFKQINEIPLSHEGPDYAGQAKAEAISEIVKAREQTNQKLLQMYETMYEDLVPRKDQGLNSHDKVEIIRHLGGMAEDNEILSEKLGDHFDTILREILK